MTRALLLACILLTGPVLCFGAEQPNVIFILADDLGYGDLGCYGQQQIQTPVLDRLADDGLRFTRFHAGSALCLPSRCTLMTGLHTGHCRCRANGGGGNHPSLDEADTTLATVMQAAGYKTAMIGKWSLGDEFVGCVVQEKNLDGSGAIYKHGWDYYFGEPNQTYNHSYYMDQMYQYDRAGLVGAKTDGKRLDVIPYPNNTSEKTHYSHDLLTGQALAFVDAARDGPFFLYLPYTIPHSRFEIPELEPYARDASWSQDAKVYASMITRMDRDIGRIVDRLEQHAIDRRTLLIFTSDNGSADRFKEFNSNGGLPGSKGSLSDGGVRVPCVAYWPGQIRGGRASDGLFAFWDLMPTCAELAGVKPPEPIDGVSMVPTLLGQRQQQKHKYLYFWLKNKARIIRGEGETRSDEAIHAEANTEVLVPVFAGR